MWIDLTLSNNHIPIFIPLYPHIPFSYAILAYEKVFWVKIDLEKVSNQGNPLSINPVVSENRYN